MGVAGSVGMFALYATGVGYGYYRAANTRLLPGQVMYLQDGSDQYVLAKPGLYFFPGPFVPDAVAVHFAVGWGSCVPWMWFENC